MSKLVLVQALRALAALSVAMLHAQHDAAALVVRTGTPFTASTLLPWEAGVDVFFVISGFIMVYASGRLFAIPGGRRIFLARRIARIVPLYWGVTTLFLLVAAIAPQFLNSEVAGPWPVIASYLFVPVARPDGLVQPVFSLGWTLNYEMLFYGLFALAIVWPRRQAVFGLMLAFPAIVAAGRLFAPLPQPLAYWTDPIILEFAFGMALGLAQAEGLRLGGFVRAALAVAGLALLSADLMRPDAMMTHARPLAYGVPAALLVAAAALGRERPARVDPAGRLGPAARIALAVGDASYALYLVHPFAIRAGREVVERSGLGPLLGPWGYVALVLAVAVVAAMLVFRFVERPAVEAVRRLIESRSAPIPAVATARGD